MKKFPKLRLPAKLRIKSRPIALKKLIIRMVVCGSILFAMTGYLAYTRLYLTPSRRFWMAISTSLSTQSVVRSVESGGTGNKQIDRTRFMFGAQAAQDKISSIGTKNATTESNLTTETITTPLNQYVRYQNIFTTDKKSDGSNYDFSSIKNVWAEQGDAKDTDAKNNQMLNYAQPFITLVPFGNLSATDRQQIVNDLKTSGAYDIDYLNPTYALQNGQKYLQFSVKVRTKVYVAVLQRFFTLAGYGTFPPLDPSNYPENARVNSQFIINMKNNNLSGVNFNGQLEQYSNYGTTKQITLPDHAIPLDDLKAKLQSAQ